MLQSLAHATGWTPLQSPAAAAAARGAAAVDEEQQLLPFISEFAASTNILLALLQQTQRWQEGGTTVRHIHPKPPGMMPRVAVRFPLFF